MTKLSVEIRTIFVFIASLMKTIKDYFIDRIRRKLKDYPEVNRLLDNEEENSSPDIEEALSSALEIFNTTIMPITSYNIETFPVNGRIYLIQFAIIELLLTNSILSSRNRLVYSDGKIGGIDTELKGGSFAELATRLSQIWQSRAMAYKQSVNVAQVGDGISSDYAQKIENEEEF